MKKITKGKLVFIIPIVAVVLFILWEVLGMICNNIAGTNQAEYVVRLWENSVGEIYDYDTFVGISGRGEHVDLVTYGIVRSDKNRMEIIDELSKEYDEPSVDPLADLIGENGGLYNFDPPEDWQDGSYYYICIYNSAPFSHNIMGLWDISLR